MFTVKSSDPEENISVGKWMNNTHSSPQSQARYLTPNCSSGQQYKTGCTGHILR